VDRNNEALGFKSHAKVGNRRLLWHGTNIAVVAAILKSGLRIMPHSGGRVGKGIYLASENGKSADYTRCANKGKLLGVMFLVEAALGKQYKILRDDSSLVKPPPGFDSVLAVGRQEPDPKLDKSITIDKHTVNISQGKAIPQAESASSSFSNSEFLLYREDQQRIRYLCLFEFVNQSSWH